MSVIFYANAVLKLFEHIPNIVEQHGRLIEGHYGEGRIGKVVERLQVEADTQRGIIIDRFIDERSIGRKVWYLSWLVKPCHLRSGR